MKSPRNTARVIVVRSDGGRQDLLVMERFRRDKETGEMLHYYSIPGGGIDPGETPEQAAVREMWEEMRIEIALGPLVALSRLKNGETHYYFLGRHVAGEPHLDLESPEALHTADDNRFIPGWIALVSGQAEMLNPVHRRLLPVIKEIAEGCLPATPVGFSEM